MKVAIILTLTIVAVSFIACLEDKNTMNKEGTTSSVETESTVEAISYALGKGKNNDFIVQNGKNFRAPVMVEKLPPKVPLNTGAVETIDEIPSAEDYYDGTKGLKITVTQCNTYTTQPEVCLHQGSCGWCGSTNSCVSGNNLGPLAPCLRGTYKFTAPSPDWNPLADGSNYSMKRETIGGAQLTTMVSHQ